MNEFEPELPATLKFKPNIYPVILWSLVYGLAAGVLLFLITVAQQFVTILWIPLFLAGVVWGGWRNYVRQKSAWLASQGQAYQPQSTTAEFREALSDIRVASRDLFESEAETPPPPPGENQPPA